MNQPDKLTYVPDWAYKTAEVKFFKIFTLCFYSEWRNNGEHKHFVIVSLFGKWDIVRIETRTGITKTGLNNYLPEIYKLKKPFSRFNKNLTDKYDKYSTIVLPLDKTEIGVEDSEFVSKFAYSNTSSSRFKI